MHDAIDEVIGLSKNPRSGGFEDPCPARIQIHQMFGAFGQFWEDNFKRAVVMTLARPLLKQRYLNPG